MSKFPRMYAESTLKRMYGKLGLHEETINLLHDYFLAFANFYFILPLKDAFKIIERQNKNLVTEEQFAAFSEIARHEEHFYWILGKDELYTQAPESVPLDREIILEYLVDLDYEEYYKLSQMQYGKQFYIPTKTELLKYCDDFYVEETPQTKAIVDFIKTEFKCSPSDAYDLMGEMVMDIKMLDSGLDYVLNKLERMDISFSCDKQVERFTELYTELHNNTRLPANRGFTPKEIYVPGLPRKISLGPNIRKDLSSGKTDADDFIEAVLETDIPDEMKLDIIGDIISASDALPSIGEKIGRNAPCPCGSGKKYKKCCGKPQ